MSTMTPLAFVDCETTGLDPVRHEMWEIAVIRREADGTETEHLWQIRPSAWHLEHVADPEALRIGRYFERAAVPEPAMAADMLAEGGPVPLDLLELRRRLVEVLQGAVMVGSNPAFDAAFLGRFLGGYPLPWHYRTVDVATLAAGRLYAERQVGDLGPVLPFSSRDLSRAVGVEPPGSGEAHQALVDARWARDVFDAVAGGALRGVSAEPTPNASTEVPEPTVRATVYTVSCLPEDDLDSSLFAVTVEDRGHGRWAVKLRSRCLGVDGTWSWEPIPSERTDEWLAAHRFDEETALRLAREHAPRVTVNGFTVADALRMYAKRKAAARRRPDGAGCSGC